MQALLYSVVAVLFIVSGAFAATHGWQASILTLGGQHGETSMTALPANYAQTALGADNALILP
jgi:hypothetical protein